MTRREWRPHAVAFAYLAACVAFGWGLSAFIHLIWGRP